MRGVSAGRSDTSDPPNSDAYQFWLLPRILILEIFSCIADAMLFTTSTFHPPVHGTIRGGTDREEMAG